MKNIKYIFILLFLVVWSTSCDHDEMLTETPKDFLSPLNSYTTKEGFDAAIVDIHRNIRNGLVTRGDGRTKWPLYGVDVDVSIYWQNLEQTEEFFHWNTMNADNGYSSFFWNMFYSWIGRANSIINRAEDEVVQWASDEEKNAIVGEAKFLRAFSYHFLANLFGGVPKVLEETSEPKFDYVRATRQEIYELCKEDLTFATQWMLTQDQVKGGKAPRAAAYHLLAEVEICLGNYDAAIAAASAVIDDPAYYLMTERFGAYKDFTFQGYDYAGPAESWGDPYWDLYREGSFNRSEGNMECIWNVQNDYALEGGGGSADAAWGGNQKFERWWASAPWLVKDLNGVRSHLKDTLMGRPVWGAMITDYMANLVWQFKDDFDKDIRNAEHNIQREYYWMNPENPKFGEVMKLEDINDPVGLGHCILPSASKFNTCIHHATAEQNGQNHDYGSTYKDWYLMRLAETYLLRAEAYLRNGDAASAAADINVVRNRAQATSVTAGEVDMDVILDERARELYGEEFRLNTLMRMGKLVEYLMKYNDGVIARGYSLPDHLNLLPIPRSEIEANTDAELEQNPGYN